MGEVRANIKITNATDEALARRGKISEVEIRCYETEAMIDTGVVQAVIPADVVNLLGLQTPDQSGVEYADGRNEVVPVTEAIVI